MEMLHSFTRDVTVKAASHRETVLNFLSTSDILHQLILFVNSCDNYLEI